MRGLKSTAALVVILGGLGAYIYYVTWKKGPDPATVKDKVFVGIDAAKIEEIKVTSDKGEISTVKKENGAWQLVSPITTKADEGEVSAITSALSTLDVVRIVDENPTDLKDYGLVTPHITVEYKATGDKDYKRLFLGEKSPSGSDMFAKRNDDKKVFLVAAFPEQTFNKSTFDLRDKIVLKFDREKVDGLEVHAGGKTAVQIAKDGAEWKITQPLQTRADYGSVEGLIGRLQTVAMKAIVADSATPADLKKYGLDMPVVSVDLKLGSASATFALGGKASDHTVYARDPSNPQIVTVEMVLADDLKKGADEYRRKDVFEFRPYNVTRIEFTRDGKTAVFEKVKGEGKDAADKWKRTSPSAADADREKMDSLLGKVSNMRATAFVDSAAKTGMAMPALTVVAKFDDGKKEERATFGKVDSDVFVAHPGEPGAVKIDPAEFTDANKTLDDLIK